MYNSAGKIWRLLTRALAVLVVVYLFYDVLLHPGTTMLGTEGDAAKNYFTFLYHGLYGDGIYFGGMNYPYGEHIVFTDAQPPFAIVLAFVNDYVPVNPLAILHLLIISGFFLGVVYTDKVICRFGVHPLWAGIAALLLVVMSPQQFKLSGHFSLAYICVLPVIFYYNLVWLQTGRRSAVYKLLLAAWLFTFIHLYFGLMICLWVVLYSIGYVLFVKQGWQKKLQHTRPVLAVGILPAILFQLFMAFTDTIADRPLYPYGARAHGTTINDVFTSYLSPFWLWLSGWFDVGTLNGGNEGYAYIGIAPLLILVIACIYWSATSIRTGKINLRNGGGNSLTVWLFIAAGMLLFASAIIFRKCFVCLDYASFIRQFRAIGRFSWPYYYIITVVAAVLAYRGYLLLKNRHKWLAKTAAVGTLLLWSAEAIPYAQMVHTRTSGAGQQYEQFYSISEVEWNEFLLHKGYSKDKFRALYSLPYFHIGTEKLGLVPQVDGQLNTAFSASLQLQLPLMNVMMSRTSWQQAFAQVKVSGGPYTHKKILQSRDYRPILLIHPEKAKLNPDEQYLLTSSQFLGSLNGNNIYALHTDSLLSKESGNRKEHKIFISSIQQVDSCIKDAGPWYVEHYDTGTSPEVLMGRGAAKAIDGITEIVFTAPLTPASDSQLYEFSAWMLVNDKDYKIGRFVIHLYDERDSLVSNIKVLAQESVDNYGLWLRVSKYFEVPASCRKISVELVNVIYPSYLALDELMIRPADALIISKSSDTRRMVNNHVLPY
jgi:hypothetical protein